METLLKLAEANPFSSILPVCKVHCHEKTPAGPGIKTVVPGRNIAAAAASGKYQITQLCDYLKEYDDESEGMKRICVRLFRRLSRIWIFAILHPLRAWRCFVMWLDAYICDSFGLGEMSGASGSRKIQVTLSWDKGISCTFITSN